MPIDYALIKTPAGNEVLRTISRGTLDGADAAEYLKNIGSTGPYFRKAVIAHMPKGVGISSEARKIFTSSQDDGVAKLPFVILVPGGPTRVIVTFLIKVSGSGDWVKVYADEAEALRYLDETLAKQDAPAA